MATDRTGETGTADGSMLVSPEDAAALAHAAHLRAVLAESQRASEESAKAESEGDAHA